MSVEIRPNRARAIVMFWVVLALLGLTPLVGGRVVPAASAAEESAVDLVVNYQTDSSTGKNGGEFTHTATVRNNSQVTATNVTLKFIIPKTVQGVSVSCVPADGCPSFEGTGSLVGTLSELPANKEITMKINGTYPTDGASVTFKFTAEPGEGQKDTNPVTNEVTQSVALSSSITKVSVTLEKEAGGTAITDERLYRFELINNGDAPVINTADGYAMQISMRLTGPDSNTDLDGQVSYWCDPEKSTAGCNPYSKESNLAKDREAGILYYGGFVSTDTKFLPGTKVVFYIKAKFNQDDCIKGDQAGSPINFNVKVTPQYRNTNAVVWPEGAGEALVTDSIDSLPACPVADVEMTTTVANENVNAGDNIEASISIKNIGDVEIKDWKFNPVLSSGGFTGNATVKTVCNQKKSTGKCPTEYPIVSAGKTLDGPLYLIRGDYAKITLNKGEELVFDVVASDINLCQMPPATGEAFAVFNTELIPPSQVKVKNTDRLRSKKKVIIENVAECEAIPITVEVLSYPKQVFSEEIFSYKIQITNRSDIDINNFRFAPALSFASKTDPANAEYASGSYSFKLSCDKCDEYKNDGGFRAPRPTDPPLTINGVPTHVVGAYPLFTTPKLDIDNKYRSVFTLGRGETVTLTLEGKFTLGNLGSDSEAIFALLNVMRFERFPERYGVFPPKGTGGEMQSLWGKAYYQVRYEGAREVITQIKSAKFTTKTSVSDNQPDPNKEFRITSTVTAAAGYANDFKYRLDWDPKGFKAADVSCVASGGAECPNDWKLDTDNGSLTGTIPCMLDGNTPSRSCPSNAQTGTDESGDSQSVAPRRTRRALADALGNAVSGQGQITVVVSGLSGVVDSTNAGAQGSFLTQTTAYTGQPSSSATWSLSNKRIQPQVNVEVVGTLPKPVDVNATLQCKHQGVFESVKVPAPSSNNLLVLKEDKKIWARDDCTVTGTVGEIKGYTLSISSDSKGDMEEDPSIFTLVLTVKKDDDEKKPPIVTPEPGTPEPGTPEPGTPEPGTPEPGKPGPIAPKPSQPDGSKPAQPAAPGKELAHTGSTAQLLAFTSTLMLAAGAVLLRGRGRASRRG